MQQHCRATERFLLAAKRAEIQSLENLAASCEVVSAVSELIHHLQRERGISNIYLASCGLRFGEQRQQQVINSRHGEQELRRRLDEHYGAPECPLGSMRLLNSIAFVLQGLDNLADLRRQIDNQQISALEATRALSRLIAGLLSVVFEAADIAGDPAVTRLLVALFNFMQGKEYAGQERAWAAIGFATGRFDGPLCERLSHLQDAQQRCFELFCEFALAELQKQWQQLETSPEVRDLNRLREMIRRLCEGEPVASEISEVWYDLATRRIDRMHQLEEMLKNSLKDVSQRQVAEAKADLRAHQDRLQTLATIAAPPSSPLNLLIDPAVPGFYGADGADAAVASEREPHFTPELAHSVYDLVRGQAEHIKRMAEELSDARRALMERKQVERAKQLLMHNLGLTEAEAYRKMQQRAMELNTRLATVAATLIEASERVQGKAPGRDKGGV